MNDSLLDFYESELGSHFLWGSVSLTETDYMGYSYVVKGTVETPVKYAGVSYRAGSYFERCIGDGSGTYARH